MSHLDLDLGLRTLDSWGGGLFGDSRGDKQHRGIDLVAEPNTPFNSIISGEVTKIGLPYSQEPRQHIKYVEITKGDYRYRFFYLLPIVNVGDIISVGSTLGLCVALDKYYPQITEHVHFEIKDKDNNYIDPTPVYLALKD